MCKDRYKNTYMNAYVYNDIDQGWANFHKPGQNKRIPLDSFSCSLNRLILKSLWNLVIVSHVFISSLQPFPTFTPAVVMPHAV